MHLSRSKDHSGALLALVSTAFYAAQFPLIKLALEHVSAAQGVVLEAFFTIVFCFILSVLVKRRPGLVPAGMGLMLGLLNAGGVIFLFESLSRVHPAVVGFLGRLYFVYAILISWLYFLERPRRSELLAAALSVAGLFLFSFNDVRLGTSAWVGILLAVLSPAFFALQNALTKQAVRGHDSNGILLSAKCASVWVFLSYLLYKSGWSSARLDLTGVGLVAASTFTGTFVGLLLFYEAFKRTTFFKANLMKATEPVFVLLFSIVLFPMALTWTSAAGIAMICLSAAIPLLP